MSVEFRKPEIVTYQASTLRASLGVRYWEDAEVNGVDESEDDPKIPMKSGDTWNLEIDISSGTILDWPEGTTAKTHYKVCDAGVYTLVEESGKVIGEVDGYVPAFLAPNGGGYGDYVILDINEKGEIDGWYVDIEEWEDFFNPENEY